MATTQRGVARKGQFAARAEDADAVVRAGGAALRRGRQQESALGKVGPVREILHLGGGDVFAIQHHRKRVAAVRRGREDVDLLEGAVFHVAALGCCATFGRRQRGVLFEAELQVLQDFSPHGRRAVLRHRLGTVVGQNLQRRPFEIGCGAWVLLRRGTNR